MVEIGFGSDVKVTRAMRMSLIMHSYNQGNFNHVFYGGVTVPDWDLYRRGKKADAYGKGKTYFYENMANVKNALANENYSIIEEYENSARGKIQAMEKELSDWEKKFLESAKELFWKQTGKLINETSLQLKGYAIAKVSNYFPVKTDANYIKKDITGLIMDGTIEGMGMLKERKFGRNALILEDITDVILRQMENTATYAGMAIPMRNVNMTWNSIVKGPDGLDTMKKAINNVWGIKNEKYIENLMADINGGRDGGDSTFLDHLRGNFAGAVLTLNPSVAIKQTASYPTAAGALGWKPIVKALKDMGKGFGTRNGIEELERRNPLLWYRNQGNATQDLADIKKNSLIGKLPQKVQLGINWIEIMDTGTVRTLEYASMYYVDDTYKNLTKGTPEYWDMVSEVFTKVVEETQPNYTVLQQADIIRNPNKALKLLIMFKTQPMQNFGILYDSLGELVTKSRKKASGAEMKKAKQNFANALSSQIASAILFSFMSMMASVLKHKHKGFRDDDDKFSWLETLKTFGTGVVDVFLGSLLFGQEVYEWITTYFNDETYYGLEVSTVEMVNDLHDNLQNFFKGVGDIDDAITEEDREKANSKIYYYGMNLVNTVGEFFGVPSGNIKNMVESLYLYTKDVIAGDLGSSKILKSSEIDTQKEKMYQAFAEGNFERYEALMKEQIEKKHKAKLDSGKAEEDIDEDEIRQSIETSIKTLIKNDFNAQEITYDQAFKMLTDMGMTNEDAYYKLDEWLYKSEGNDKYSQYSRMLDAIDANDRKEIVNQINLLLKNGHESKDIISKITSEYKKQYLELKKQGKAADMKNLLISCYMACGMKREDAMEKIDKWK